MVERSQILFEVDDEMLMRNGVSSSAIRNNRFISFTSTVVILVSSSGASMKREISWQGLCERANGIVLALRSLIFINDLCISIQDYDKAFQRYEIFLWN